MIVVDASVLVKVLTGEPGADAALASVAAERDRIAPDWIRLEVASAISKKVNLGELRRAHADAALAHLSSILTEVVASMDLLDRAFEIAIELKHAIYDCLYLALAERLDCTLVTADSKFASKATGSPYDRFLRVLG